MPNAAGEYWNERYATPTWSSRGGIHFAVPGARRGEAVSEREEFAAGLYESDRELLRLLRDCVSRRAWQFGFAVLELGCGEGSFARLAISEISHITYVGLDIAPSAVEQARSLSGGTQLRRAVTAAFIECDIREASRLETTLNETGVTFDAVVARECLYLLSAAERQTLLAMLSRFCSPGAVMIQRDLAVSRSWSAGARKYFSQRQGGGEVWEFDPTNDTIGTWHADTRGTPWIEEDLSVRDGGRIGHSYRTALALNDGALSPDLREAYAALGEAGDRFRYVTRILRHAIPEIAIKEEAGLTLTVSSSEPRLSGLKAQFNVRLGRTTLLLGRNGAGKSTLFDAVFHRRAGLVKVHPVVGRRFLIRSSPQIVAGLTVLQHVALFASTPGEAPRALARLGLTELAHRDAAALSSGQAQSVSIAQALVARTELLLLDEPTQHLDPYARAFFFDSVRAIQATDPKPTILWADHSSDIPVDVVDDYLECESLP